MSVCHAASDGNTMKFYNHKKSHPMINVYVLERLDLSIRPGMKGMKMRLGVRLHVLQTTLS